MLYVQLYSQQKPGKPKEPLIARQIFIILILLPPNNSV